MNNGNCEEERREAFRRGRRMGFWLAKNEKKWRKDIQQKERRKDIAVMREQEGAMEGLSDVFGRAEARAQRKDEKRAELRQRQIEAQAEVRRRLAEIRQERRAIPAPVSALSAPLAPQPVPAPAPSPAPSAQQRLALLYTDERIRGMNKDEAREALRALGGNPRREGSRDYRPAEEVRELIRQRRRDIQG